MELVVKPINLELVAIPEGNFLMDSPADGVVKNKAEISRHLVHFNTFFIGKYPVTQSQWKTVTGLPKIRLDLNPEPSYFREDNHPVEQVSWYEAVEFCERLSFIRGKQYRLPTEAEWEYACRAGTTTDFCFGSELTADLANYQGCPNYKLSLEGIYEETTTPVGSYPANQFGLHDMHGNVWEWCADLWQPVGKAALDNRDARLVESSESYRVLRGGSWCSPPINCRSAERDKAEPDKWDYDIGFRVVCLY